MKRPLACLACLLLMPAVQAAGDGFSASSIDLPWSDVVADAPVLAFRGDGVGHAFELDAQAVRAESDSVRFLTVGPTGYGTRAPRTDTASYGPSSWAGTTSEDVSSLVVIAGEARVASVDGSGVLDAPPAACLPVPTYFAHRSAPCPAIADAVHLRGAARSWSVTGNFTLVLWSWHGSVQGEGGPDEFWTGSRPVGESLAGQGQTELRQAFLEVTGGVLRLTPSRAAPVDVHGTAFTFTTPGPVTLQDAAGRRSVLPVGRDGSLDVVRDGPALAARTQRAVQPDGDVARLLPAWSLGAFAMLVLVAPAGWVMQRRHNGLLHLTRADRNLELGNFAAARRHARRARSQGRLRDRACVVGAVACLQQGDLAGAQDFLRHLHRGPRHDEAACRFLLANVRIRQGRHAEGESLLEACLRLDPSYKARAAASPVLAPFLDPTSWPEAS